MKRSKQIVISQLRKSGNKKLAKKIIKSKKAFYDYQVLHMNDSELTLFTIDFEYNQLVMTVEESIKIEKNMKKEAEDLINTAIKKSKVTPKKVDIDVVKIRVNEPRAFKFSVECNIKCDKENATKFAEELTGLV